MHQGREDVEASAALARCPLLSENWVKTLTRRVTQGIETGRARSSIWTKRHGARVSEGERHFPMVISATTGKWSEAVLATVRTGSLPRSWTSPEIKM